MKKIILGDTHFGIKNFSIEFFENQKKFFEEQLFPYMRSNNIKEIIQLGDFFDNRISIDINYLNKLQKFFLDNNDINWITFLGNHDIYYKNTREVNLITLFASICNNISVISNPTVTGSVGYQPWIINENLVDCEVLLGHFEINGFSMAMGMTDTHSILTKNMLAKYKRVFSGHYHKIQQIDNITYVGTPYELSWGEVDSQHGFWEYDFNTDELGFIENIKSKKHIKITLDNDQYIIESGGSKYNTTYDNMLELLESMDKDEVKVIVNSQNNDIELPKIKEILPTVNIQDSVSIEAKEVQVCSSSQQFITSYIELNHSNLITEFKELLKEI